MPKIPIGRTRRGIGNAFRLGRKVDLRLETEKCRFCGASVKKENLNAHYGRVHPKLPGSTGRPAPTFARPASFLKSHRKRNVGIVVGIVMLSIVIIAVTLTATNNMSGISSNPGPAA